MGRPNNRGYPIRGIVKKDFLYIRNFETDRWPGGNPETGYLNCDGSPIGLLIDQRRKGETKYWRMSFGKRKQTELYDLTMDSDCVVNILNTKMYSETSRGTEETKRSKNV